MNVFVVEWSHDTKWVMSGVFWTAWDAHEELKFLLKNDRDARITVVPIAPLSTLVNDYFRYRKYNEPGDSESFEFLVSEVGELADARVHSRDEWVRNNPDRLRDVNDEMGDVLMMLTKLAYVTGGGDPIELMVNKMRRVSSFDTESRFTMMRRHGIDSA